MRVKVIYENQSILLEKAVNRYLEECERVRKKVVDIKFGGMHRVSHGEPYWTAMIIVE